MRWHGRFAALLIVFSLLGCAQAAIGQGKTSHAPYSDEDRGYAHDGSDGGSGM